MLLRPLEAAVFDLDGLLIDSEPHWRSAEIEVFGGVGVALSEGDCGQTTGLRLDEVVRHWAARRPWTSVDHHTVHDRIVEAVARRIRAHGVPLPGAIEAVRACAARGLRLGLATSSPTALIGPALERLGLADAFAAVCSAEDETHGKPHPAVYLRAAERLGAPPTACVAFEDSLNGVIAAKAARMICVAVPDRDHPGFAIADVRLRSLTDLDLAAFDRAALGA